VPYLTTPTMRFAALGVALLAALPLTAKTAVADATLVIEADTGKVLHAEHATYPWYPASTSKLMTMYLTLKAVKEGRLTMDSLVTVSPNAVAQAPSKMGFAAGTQLTVDNALKMMMVKSANDIAVVLAEAVGGSIEGFADQMNAASRRLGMTQSSWVNPNGLPADEQITSPRDMAMLARAILKELPEYEFYWHIPAIKFGKRVMRNTNGLIGRYPDADGMKTGFICASGFNVVATATRNGRKLIVVVFGSSSGAVRSEKAAQLFEKGFSNTGLSWLMPSLGTVDALQPIAAAPPNLRDDMCGKNRRRPATESADEEDTPGADADSSSAFAATLQSLRGGAPKQTGPLLGPMAAFVPVPVYIGPKRNPGDPALAVADAPIKRKKPSAATAAVANTVAKETLAKPALANAAGGKSKKQAAGTFAPASAKEKPVPAPGEKKAAAKPKTKPAPKPTKTAEKPDAKPAKQ
jgi:D-alanyl-D-alanine carboxypeptidase